MADDEKEIKRKKQVKRMTKIISKAWSIPNSEPFQEWTKHPSQPGEPLDLTSVGRALDNGRYPHGRSGWETFANDIGGVYTWHILSKDKHSTAAKAHGREVQKLLGKVDPHLAELASKSEPKLPATNDSALKSATTAPGLSKKRKAESSNSDLSVPKKKHVHGSLEKTLTLSQREQKGLDVLGVHLEECGGLRSQANTFRCKAVQRPGSDKFDIVYFSTEGKRFRSMIEVSRFLNLSPDDKSKRKSNNSSVRINSSRPQGHREIEAEKKKLRRELDKLVKAHSKASKSLDEIRNSLRGDSTPIEDELLLKEQMKIHSLPDSDRTVGYISHRPNLEQFPGIPAHCTSDVLMVWDFLCTFSRTLSLQPISIDDFATALTYTPKEATESMDGGKEVQYRGSPPVFLAEAHLALLRLLLQDTTSDDWWWSTLESDELLTEEKSGTDQGKHDDSLPVIKVDMQALLAVEEDPDVTAKWLQALEDVRTRKTNAGAPIKSAVKSAIKVTTNPLVKGYLKKSMRNWKSNAAGFTKRAVVWLVERVREARPDIWGRHVNPEDVAQQKIKVAKEAALVMDQVDENAYIDNGNDDEEGLEDDSDSDESDDEEEDEEDFDEQTDLALNTSSEKDSVKEEKQIDDDHIPVKSAIPVKPAPSIVDLLLPPSKPLFTSDLVSPLTWSCLTGATGYRILHRYKRRRNEVDDTQRETWELKPMSIRERREREGLCTQRVLSECAASYDGVDKATETALESLCNGMDYIELTPVQKLCILRLLVEAAYDTTRVHASVEDNFTSRINAMKALETEERRAKREAKEETAVAEASARERLASESRATFLEKKRLEIIQSNETSNEFPAEFIENMTDEDVAEFDSETTQEYESLPAPENFNKSEVNAMVAKIQEEAAFGTNALTVLTMDEIKSNEEEHLLSLKKELSSFGDVASVYELHTADRETSAKIDRLRKEVANLEDLVFSLPFSRAEAVESLKDAMEDSTIKELKSAIKLAKIARLMDIDESTGGVWALDLLRDAALELRNAERRKRVTEAQKDLVAKLKKCFIRTKPLGRDRYNNYFWQFDCDQPGRVWIDANYHVIDSLSPTEVELPNPVSLVMNEDLAVIGAKDREDDFLNPDLSSSSELKSNFLKFCRQEYYHSGKMASLVRKYWGCHSTDQSLRQVVKSLNSRGIREGPLKASLKEMLDASGAASAEAANPATHADVEDKNKSINEEADKPNEYNDMADNDFQTASDEEAFLSSKALAQTESDDTFENGQDFVLLENVSSAIGRRVRLRLVPDPISAPSIVEYDMGKVTGWKMLLKPDLPSTATWKVTLDHGGESFLSGSEIVHAMCRAMKWESNHDGSSEEDASFLSYRNNLGRFCGRAADAPTSSSPQAFVRHMIKREQEFYTPLKNRAIENIWGGKSGARNSWVATMREHGSSFSTVAGGLLTLEEAFFELSGGFAERSTVGDDIEPSSFPISETFNGKELLKNESYRLEIELESIGVVAGLWNSKQTRAIFKEIVQSSKTIGTLALCFELLCRNCNAYLEATKTNVTRNTFSDAQPVVGSRRQAALQSYHHFF